jgi:hypothetical protein
MTILQPNKHKQNFKSIFAWCLMAVAICGLYIFQYNSLVGARFEMKQLKNGIEEMELSGSELKSKLYASLDPAELKQLAIVSGLVVENRPQYMRVAGQGSVAASAR